MKSAKIWIMGRVPRSLKGRNIAYCNLTLWVSWLNSACTYEFLVFFLQPSSVVLPFFEELSAGRSLEARKVQKHELRRWTWIWHKKSNAMLNTERETHAESDRKLAQWEGTYNRSPETAIVHHFSRNPLGCPPLLKVCCRQCHWRAYEAPIIRR